jgi:predicted CopG family antitoxin
MNEDGPRVQEYTTIRISREVYERLCGLGRKGETFDSILRRILSREASTSRHSGG